MPGRHRSEPAGRSYHWLRLVLAVAVAAGVGVAIALLTRGGGSSGGPDTLAQSAQPTASPAVSRTPSPTPTPTPTVRTSTAAPAKTTKPPAPPPVLALTITGGQSWVQVSQHGGPVLFQGTLQHGAHQVYSTGVFDLVLGDAGAVSLVVHGHTSAPAGRPGQVVRMTVR